MKKIYVMVISLILMGNSAYASVNDSRLAEDKNQCLSSSIEKIIEGTVQNIVSQSKKIRIATQEGQRVIVYSGMNALIILERVDDSLDAEDSFNAGVIVKDGEAYLTINDVRKIINARVDKNQKTNKITLSGYGVRVEMNTEGGFAQIDGKEIEMSSAPIIMDDECYFPAKWIEGVFGRDMVYGHKDNQDVLLIRPKTILQDLSGNEKILFFKSSSIMEERKNRKPFLTFKKESEIKAFAKLVNNGVEISGIVDREGTFYIVEVYDKEKVIKGTLSMRVTDSGRYGGIFTSSEGSKHGYALLKDDVNAFLKIYGHYFEE